MKDSKYEEALERARQGLPMDEVFPELKESEDERLRKLLVWQVYRNIEDETNDLARSVYDGIKGHDPDLEESIEDWKKCLAYLERQKEQKYYTYEQSKQAAENCYYDKDYNTEDGGRCNQQSFLWGFEEGVNWCEQQKERKSVDLSEMMVHKEPYIAPVPTSIVADEQKPAEWSEDDETRLKVIKKELEKYIMFKQYGPPLSVDDIGWLENLPERFNLQPKQKWNEEDKAIVGCIACCLDGQFVSEVARKRCLEWFNKHRRDFLNASHWKPSEEQMRFLLAVINEPNNAGSESCHLVLKELYEQLKEF